MADLEKLIAELETSPFAGRLCKRAARAIKTAIEREKRLLENIENQAQVIAHARQLCNCDADKTAQVYYRLKVAVQRMDRELN